MPVGRASKEACARTVTGNLPRTFAVAHLPQLDLSSVAQKVMDVVIIDLQNG